LAGIYVHIPFCKTRCIYCDFFSCTNLEFIKDFIKSICDEIKFQKNYLNNEIVETIYFGGGTPSLLDIGNIEIIISNIFKEFNISSKPEITIEVNPDDITDELCFNYKKLGINRLSMGIQSFDDKILKFLNRRHNASKAINAINICSKYFNNISIDLIYGIPDLSLNLWKSQLENAFKLDITHLSAYHLTYEENTKLFKLLANRKIAELSEEESNKQYEILLETAENYEFINYEISNFALEGKYSKHNSSYWKNQKYLGLGPSAHSYNLYSRQWNFSDIQLYIESINNKNIWYETENLDLKTKFNEYIMTSLRTMWGCNIQYIIENFGEMFYNMIKEKITENEKFGNIIFENDKIILTKKGKFISDKIIRDFFVI
jgi:oxygen-independent coproporphyrinogen III oxidase